jgi:hypothetical protein
MEDKQHVDGDAERKNKKELNVSTASNSYSFESPPPKSKENYSNNNKKAVSNIMGRMNDGDKTHAMILTDYTLSFMPSPCWSGNRNLGIESPKLMSGNEVKILNTIVNSFLPCGVSILTGSTTDFISIKSFGVVSFRVLFSRDMGKVQGETKSINNKNQQKPQVQIQDIRVPAPDRSNSSSMASPGDSYTNNSPSHSFRLFVNPSTTSFKMPWPCSKVEAMIMQRNSDFPCILELQTYSTSSIRSSAASTPQGKPQNTMYGR